MHFSHHPDIPARFPELAAGALAAGGIHAGVDVAAQIAHYESLARDRLRKAGSESDLPEVQAWRRTFAAMGLKPTQYRCASESLLRRFRKEGALPRLHPLIDVCNAISMAFAIPVAVLDTAHIAQWLQVRFARGDERYLTFGGEVEQPEPGEVTFVDADGNAHARRWTHRQSGLSAVRKGTRDVLIVTEALHASAREEVEKVVDAIAEVMKEAWGVEVKASRTEAGVARFEFEDGRPGFPPARE